MDLPDIPSEIRVPKASRLVFRGEGYQIYRCNSQGSWEFQAPLATLRDEDGQVVEHFVGPTWQADDGSSVVGKKLAEITIDSTAVPWLLVEAASNTGNGKLSHVKYIQRLETRGGNHPSEPCKSAAVAQVPYSAIYVFYT